MSIPSSRSRKHEHRESRKNPVKDPTVLQKTTSGTKPAYIKEQTEDSPRVEIAVEPGRVTTIGVRTKASKKKD